jgi:hypothetical protein
LPFLKSDSKNKQIIVFIYLVMFIFFITKMIYYAQYVGRFPDETCHISYIATLIKDNAIIPDFKNMKILQLVHSFSATTDYTKSGTYIFGQSLNYLGHPPLYYQIMRLSGGITVNNNIVTVNMFSLRLFNMVLSSLTLLLIFYLGYTRIGKSRLMHLLYATIVVSVPMLSYVCAGINNDNLALIGVSLFVFGLIRFSELKHNYFTFILISVGITISFLSKLTTGTIISFSIIFFLLFYLLKNKNLNFLKSKQFLVTVPIYFIFIAYYVAVYFQTHSIQPTFFGLDPKGFYASGFYVLPSNRIDMSFIIYIKMFLGDFFGNWISIVSHIALLKYGSIFSIQKTALLSLCVLPLMLFWKFRGNDKLYMLKSTLISVYLGVVATISIQTLRAYYEYKNVSGYLGGSQSRYYLCTISAIALAIVFFTKSIYENQPKKHLKLRFGNKKISLPIRKTVTGFICVVFIGLLFYEDFIYFLINFKDYLK